MKQIISTIVCALAFIFVLLPAKAQQYRGVLVKGKDISVKIQGGEKHCYQLFLPADEFVFLKVIQQGADVKVSITAPDGGKMSETDSPNGDSGPEYVTFSSGKKGDYQVGIEALGVNGPDAGYAVKLEILRPKATSQAQKIDELFVPWNQPNSPGASVAVLKAGKVIFQKGYGMANIENHVANSEKTLFHIASVTKTFTSYGLLLLEKQGKLNLEDDIRKYLSEVPDFGHKITLRQLLQHTSGIRTYESLHAMSGYEIHSKEPFYKLISRQRDLNFLPGAEYEYSNTGFVLLASVIERVSGMPYPDFIKSNIFEPLKMTTAVFQDEAGKVIAGAADSYEPGPAGPRKLYVVNDLLGSTGIATTAADLATWGAHLVNPGIHSDIITKMKTPGKLNNGNSTPYGLGLAIASHKGHLEIGHSGAEGGFKAHLSVFPDDDLVVVVLANASDIYSRPVAREIADFYLKPVKEVAQPVALTQEGGEPVGTEKTHFDKTKLDLDQYVGTYYSDELETFYRISVIGGKLTAQHSFLKDIELSPLSAEVFTMEGWDGKAEFIKDQQHAVSGLRFSYNRMHNLFFRKIPSP